MKLSYLSLTFKLSFERSFVPEVNPLFVLSKQDEVLPGRNRASHPFSFNEEGACWQKGERIKDFVFTVTLYGRAIEYFSSIYKAFVFAGINGVSYVIKERKIDSA